MRPLLVCALFSAGAQVLFAAPPTGTPSAARESATIRVTLPADARLTVDGQPTQSTSAERLFLSPPLEPGRDFRYTFRAEFLREGKTIAVQQDVIVRAGRETAVSLDVPGGASARYTPGGPAYAYGRGSPETRAFYYTPESPPSAAPPAPPPPPPYVRPEGLPRSLWEERFPHWGIDPSDPRYHEGM
jgi:uncharacterized protein (TIGR03000 family)